MKKNYVTPTNEIILLDAENILTIIASSEAAWDNVDSVNYDELFK